MAQQLRHSFTVNANQVPAATWTAAVDHPDSKVYWTFNGQTHSIAEQQFVDVPAARMAFHLVDCAGEFQQQDVSGR